ncbi:MAG TPA: putative nucleotidyltransferase substrate binding domain-containing protein [Solirubrobacteraceae bacterium]|nr:putative nucleotidyltransferase substrate binding domain-containing protein [Solirubrobacteraceae bacterium]
MRGAVDHAAVLDGEPAETFLTRYPPFHQFDAVQLGAVLHGAARKSLPAGAVVLVEDGVPATGLWVVLDGSFEVLHEGEAIQVLEPGECFGHPSLLTGMAPAFTVRSREPSECVVIAAAPARALLGTPAGAEYVARTLRWRLTSAGHTVHALRDVGTTPVSAIMRPARFVSPETPVREVLDALADVEAVLVAGSPLGIVTDADVRVAAAADRLALDAPVATLARSPVATTPVGQLAVEATVDMLSAGARELVVLDGERVCGVLSAGALLGLEAHSPIALRHTVLGAADETVLQRAVARLPQLFLTLARAGVPSRDLGRVLSLQHDAVVARLIDFSIWRSGPAPTAWTWLDLGSSARREFTLASDQDNGLAYETPQPGEEDAVDGYFARLGRDVNEGLARCGFGVDNNGVMAGDRRWRMSRADWLRTFDDCLRIPDESHLIRATVAFDFRTAAGGLAVTAALDQRIRSAPRHPEFMGLLARASTGFPVALGFRGQLATGRYDEGAGHLDLKRGAIIPLINLVRYHAIAHGVTISSTLDRIEAVASVGGLSSEAADALREAFEVITRLRFEHHAALIAAGAPPDNLIDPSALAPIARGELREALHQIRAAQRRAGG